MSYTTRTDLLARASANRVAQLACPTDMPMARLSAVRAVLEGAPVESYPEADRPALTGALAAVDGAISAACSQIESYGVPADASTPLLTRLATTLAMYYLQGAERMTPELQKQYDAVVAMLRAHNKGEIMLVPSSAPDPTQTDGVAQIESGARRYGGNVPITSLWDW